MMILLDKLKAAVIALEPKVAALIALAPFLAGVLVGYLLRGPIHLLIDLALDVSKLIMKL